MQFMFTGFTPDTGFRVLSFEGIGADKLRTKFTVKTDLVLVRKYGILVQELPLLCRGLLERRDEGDQGYTLIFTEDEMRKHADNRAADRAAAQRKPIRRFIHHQSSAAGQNPQNSQQEPAPGYSLLTVTAQ